MLLEHVNINIGTNSSYRQSSGNTLPLVQYPFGMQALVLQTDGDQGGWFYKPTVDYAEGIRFSNQPSPWLGDYGNLTIMPVSSLEKVTNGERHSTIRKNIFNPGELEIEFIRYQTKINAKPLKYGAQVHLEFNSPNKYLLIDCPHRSEVKGQSGNFQLAVYGDNDSYGKYFKKYYNFQSDQIKEIHTIERNNQIYYGIEFNDATVELVISTSYISFEQACLNTVKSESASSEWERLLGMMEIESSPEYNKLYYSNLYRVLLYPHTLHEQVDGIDVYKNFETGQLDQGKMFVDVGFWDTYRTTMPLLRVYYNQIYRDIIEANINFYKSYNWLGRWISPVERGIMPSTLTDSVIAEAIVTDNVAPEQISIAIEALLKNGQQTSENELHGRRHLEAYLEYGFVPADISHESVSMSLDNAYSDYSIAKALEKVEDERAQLFFERANNYVNLFNPQSKMFERKDTNNKFDPEFKPDEWGTDFCESSGYQNNFNVPHDPQGLIELFGSKQEVINRLDYIFNSKPTYHVGRYGFEIHEMTEFARCELGYFAISNQPSFILPFYYLICEEPHKFEEARTRTLEYFSSSSYPGDEDNGSLSAWLIWMLIGKYPFTPADGELIDFEPKVKFIDN